MSATIEEIIETDRTADAAAPTNSAVAAAVKPRRHRRPKPVRLQDVAKASGVSVATVSMVVNNNPRISPATKKRVQRYIDQLGYLPNRSAQIISGTRQPSIAVLLPPQRHTFADVYFGELISGIADAAARATLDGDFFDHNLFTAEDSRPLRLSSKQPSTGRAQPCPTTMPMPVIHSGTR